jgi:hypothetical protein
MTGYILIFQISIHSHRQAFQKFLIRNHKDLKKIEILPSELYKNTAEITWDKGHSEMLMNHELYDIILIKQSREKVELYLVSDKEEKEMNEKFQNSSDMLYGNSASGGNLVKNFLTLEFTFDQYVFVSEICSSQRSYILHSLKPFHGFTTVSTPPPLV